MRETKRGEYVVIAVAACLSVLAFLWHFHRGDILLDGDAISHIALARKVFDSRTPGPLQLGTVWLPLPHILMMPFLVSDWLWHTGVGGSIPSMVAYVFSALGIFRLVGRGLDRAGNERHAACASWFAALLFALNPNLLYLQSTAMTESLYLALFIWAVVYFSEFAAPAGETTEAERSRVLRNCGLCLAGAMLTRYDGWFAAGMMACAVVVVAWRRAASRVPEAIENRNVNPVTRPLRAISKFLALVAVVPAFWLTYNAVVFGNPLDFAIGPYSARAIAQRAYASWGLHPPGFHSLHTALFYFLKAVQLNLGSAGWGKFWLAAAAVGAILILVRERQFWPWFALWIPLPFYALSIAYGGAAIHVPQWWPFSYYNLRYGVQLLPAIAVFSAIAMFFAARRLRGRLAVIPLAALAVVLSASYASTWGHPICLTEARVNQRSRLALETRLADFLRQLPPTATFLTYTGGHVGALQQADIPFRRVIYEGNHGDWTHPLARIGLWDDALSDPASYVDYVIGFDDDDPAISARKHGLREIAEFKLEGQPRAVVYATGR